MAEITLDDVRGAPANFGTQVRRTPLLPSTALGAATGARVWLKAENLQHTGSFKTRGAMNRIAALTEDERARGVVAASAGNHAQGVAVAAKAFGVRATIVMPRTTPLAKVQATRDYGADVIIEGDSYEAAVAHAKKLTAERRLVPIPAFDDPLIVAGQGTVGLEILEDMPDVDVVLVPVGGGGLAGGIGMVMKTLQPRAVVIGVQVEAAPGAAHSRALGKATRVPPQPTMAEGIAVAGPSEFTFSLLQKYLDDVVVVSEDEVAQAMVLLLERSKLVVEGAGAVGVAALLSRRIDVVGKRVVAVLSGGNVDINMLARVVEHGLMREGRYFSLTVGVDDKPGQLAMLAALISDAGANVLSVAHHRFGIALPVGRVQVVWLLEVRDRAHAEEIERTLETAGFSRAAEAGRFVPAPWLEQEASGRQRD